MKKSYTILSIDLGGSMGWALYKDGVMVKSGVASFKKYTDHPGFKFVKFNEWLSNWRNAGIDEIAYEDVMHFSSGHSAKAYSGYLAHLQTFALLNRIRLCAIKPKTVKMEFTGNGNANKVSMCEVAHKMGWEHGYKGTDIDHDECDAIAIGFVVLKRRGTEAALYQRPE